MPGPIAHPAPPSLAAVTPTGAVALPSAGATPARARRPALAGFVPQGEGWAALAIAIDTIALGVAEGLTLAGRDPWTLPVAVLLPVLAFPGLAVATVASVRRQFERLRSTPTQDLLGGCAAVLAVACLLGFAPIWLGEGTGAARLLATASAYSVALLCGARLPLLLVRRWARARGLGARRTLIVGAGVVGVELARHLGENPSYGLEPVGFLDADPAPLPGAAEEGRPVPVLGAPDDLERVVAATGATQVIVAYTNHADRTLRDLIGRGTRLGLHMSVVPRLFDAMSERAAIDSVGGLAVVHLRPADPRGTEFAMKHALDRVAALLGLIGLSPMLAVIALLVRATSPGPVFFRQRRVGRDGQVFDILKFRTMRAVDGADEDDAPRAFRPAAGHAPGGVEEVDRRTRIGRILRSTSLDELPQLINVLRGEMSLVGPRPERPEFVALFESGLDRYGERHRVRSGITGMAQVHGLRGQTRLDDRIRWDNWYIENWSVRLDAQILLATAATLLRRAE